MLSVMTVTSKPHVCRDASSQSRPLKIRARFGAKQLDDVSSFARRSQCRADDRLAETLCHDDRFFRQKSDEVFPDNGHAGVSPFE